MCGTNRESDSRLSNSTDGRVSAANQDQSVLCEESGNVGAKLVGVVSAVLRWPKTAVHRLYDWTTNWSRTRNAPYALSAI